MKTRVPIIVTVEHGQAPPPTPDHLAYIIHETLFDRFGWDGEAMAADVSLQVISAEGLAK